jgi:phospholipase/lecithinase/hemolysin
MHQIKLRQVAATAILAVGALSGQWAVAAVAAPSFSDVYFFGDSLSDTGNTQALFAGFGFAVPNPVDGPYAGGRFSNGPIWTEYLAAGLGFAGAAKPLYLGGNNYSFAGARTGGLPSMASPIPSLTYQTQVIWGATTPTADADALYVVVAGGNDMRDARTTAPGTNALNTGYRQLAAEAAVANLKSSLGLLAQRGAKNVLVSNVPDLGATPEAMFLEFGTPGVVAASTDATNRFNALMPQLLSYGASVGLNVTFLDMAAATKAVRDNPAAFGITNTSLPCAGFTGSAGASCDVSTFSDVLHPSSRGHQIIADAAFEALGVTPVPEPQTIALMLAGLALVGSAARRRSRNAKA